MDDITAAKNMAERLRGLCLPTATEAAALLEEQAEKLRFYAICMNTGGADGLRQQMRALEVRIVELTAPRTPDAYRTPNRRGKFDYFDGGDTVTVEAAAVAEPLYVGPRPAAPDATEPRECNLMKECMGPLFGEPHCPCKMEELGLPPSASHRRAAGLSDQLLQALAPEYFAAPSEAAPKRNPD